MLARQYSGLPRYARNDEIGRLDCRATLSMNRCGRTIKSRHCERSAAVYDPRSPWIAASLTLLSMNRCVIANEVKQSMTSDCMDCRAALAVTGTLFMVRLQLKS